MPLRSSEGTRWSRAQGHCQSEAPRGVLLEWEEVGLLPDYSRTTGELFRICLCPPAPGLDGDVGGQGPCWIRGRTRREERAHSSGVGCLVKVDPATSVPFGHSPVAFSALGGEL